MVFHSTNRKQEESRWVNEHLVMLDLLHGSSNKQSPVNQKHCSFQTSLKDPFIYTVLIPFYTGLFVRGHLTAYVCMYASLYSSKCCLVY